MSWRLNHLITALHEVYGLAHGLTALLDYEPAAVQAPPLLYTLLDSFTRNETAAQSETRYRLLSRVVFSLKNRQQAEADLRYFASELPRLLADEPDLNGTLQRGRARVSDATTGFLTIDGNEYRVLDIYTDLLDKEVKQPS